MTERSYQDAVQLLSSRMGGRWEGTLGNGRDEMVRILKEELGYDTDRARETIDAMIESGSLRYHQAAPGATPVVPVAAAGGTISSGPIAAPAIVGAGYWQIGESIVESTSRKGQVAPS